MNTVQVIKSTATASDLEKINTFSKKELSEEEVYVFKVLLCDNEVDRDFEHFTISALNTLGELFLGKTGIFDHNPTTSNQTARIFDTYVETDHKRKTALGEEYTALYAKAYIFKNNRTAPLIDEIEAGIKKEISVGCSVGEKRCDICGEKMGECEHRRGEKYEGQVCTFSLENPLDAYEFSFVAVPAQRNAGVVKSFSVKELSLLENDVTLTKSQLKQLGEELKILEKSKEKIQKYEGELRKEVMSLFYINFPQISRKILAQMLNALDLTSLSQLKKDFSLVQITSQLSNKSEFNTNNGEFLI